MHTTCTSSFPLIEAAICNIALGLKRSKQDDIGLIKKWMTGKLLLLHAFGVELLSLWSLGSCFAQDSEQSSHAWVFLHRDSNKCYPWFLNATEYLAILRSEFCNWIEKIIRFIFQMLNIGTPIELTWKEIPFLSSRTFLTLLSGLSR